MPMGLIACVDDINFIRNYSWIDRQSSQSLEHAFRICQLNVAVFKD